MQRSLFSLLHAPRHGALTTVRAVHETAQKGFTAAAADSYEQGRPEYTLDSLRQIGHILRKSGPLQNVTTEASYKIVELGAGTGKFTQSFVKFAPQLHNVKLTYVATEPSEGFRTRLASKN